MWFYRFARPIVKAFFYIVYRPKVIGKENVLKEGKVVIACNHQNNFDCIALIATNYRTIRFLAKDELIKGKFAWLFKAMGIIPVNRREKDKSVIPAAVNILKNRDDVIGIFPEGTFNNTDDVIMKFKVGAVKIAHDSDSYIVPCFIEGKYKPFVQRMKITYGKAYKVKSDDLDKENEILMKKVRELAK